MKIHLLMQSHPAAAGLREKSFPYLEELTIIFGKDRATKAGAEALANVVEEIDREEATNPDNEVEICERLEDIMESISLTRTYMALSSTQDILHNFSKSKKASRS